MDVFNYGEGFFEINWSYLTRYAEGSNTEEVEKYQNMIIDEIQKEREINRNRKFEMPDFTSSEEED